MKSTINSFRIQNDKNQNPIENLVVTYLLMKKNKRKTLHNKKCQLEKTYSNNNFITAKLIEELKSIKGHYQKVHVETEQSRYSETIMRAYVNSLTNKRGRD